jgi:ABC-2 type transport system ATP-binding protein
MADARVITGRTEIVTNSIVQTEGLWHRFGHQDALRGLSMSVPEGEAYALIGANGAGKTTAMKVLMNLLIPSRGEARVMGVESRRLDPKILARIGYVSATHALPRRMQVDAYLEYVRRFYPGWDVQLEASLRKQLQLPGTQLIKDLSFGTRMKLALVAALSYRPRLLVLDEPLAGLDPSVRDEFMAELLREASEVTVLITSHELSEIESVTTRVGFIHRGRMLLEEPRSELAMRVREVRISAEQPISVPQRWPAEWLEPRVFGNVITFVDTRHTPDAFADRVRALFGSVRHIDAASMSLRALFSVLERTAQMGEDP